MGDKETLVDSQLLGRIALNELERQLRLESASDTDDPVGTFFGGGLPPIEVYRAEFDVDTEPEFNPDTLSKECRSRFDEIVGLKKERMRQALESGIDDNREPLDEVRRSWFQTEVDEFCEDDYPDEIPESISEAQCNVFGHICPVFFAAESFTETSDARRRGRYIPFKTKVRIVRRDNYTCQHCGKHLNDGEVEFDHIIPVSKGGSSEEHNLRLTCFDCNRDKSADVEI